MAEIRRPIHRLFARSSWPEASEVAQALRTETLGGILATCLREVPDHAFTVRSDRRPYRGTFGERPEPGYIATSCGNAALMMFTQCLGGECVRDGVRIVGVNPGPIMSDRHRKGVERVAERELGSKDRWLEMYKRFPAGRPGRVDEVANMVAFLASDLASYISGEIIRIDAGLKVRDPVY